MSSNTADIVCAVRAGSGRPAPDTRDGNGARTPLRPFIDPTAEVDADVAELMRRCWAEEAKQRPSLHQVKTIVRRKNK